MRSIGSRVVIRCSTTADTLLPGTSISPRHAVKFYGDDDSLFSTVAGFLAQGLANGPAVIIATEEHRAGLVRRLSELFVDVARAARESDLVLLDARGLLDTFLVDGKPDLQLFQEKVGRVIEHALARRPNAVVRAYGEMVDLLWKDGESESAIQLEIMWNQLALQHGFALLCGYSMGHFYKQAVHYSDVCAQHAEVLPDEHILFFPPREHAKGR